MEDHDDDQTPAKVPNSGPFPRFPIWPGYGEGIPDSGLGRNRESGNPPFPEIFGRDRESRSRDRESGSESRAGGTPGISWSGRLPVGVTVGQMRASESRRGPRNLRALGPVPGASALGLRLVPVPQGRYLSVHLPLRYLPKY
jgi:hypothetical protein